MYKICIGCVLATLVVITETNLQLSTENRYHSRNISKSLNIIILQEFTTRAQTFNIYAKYHPSRKSNYDDILVEMLREMPPISVKMAVNQSVSSTLSSNFLILVDTLQSLRFLIQEVFMFC